jgi:hypothetical protein
MSSAAIKRALDRETAKQADKAAKFVTRSLNQFLRNNPDPDKSLFEMMAETVLEQAFRVYGDAAAKAACDAYDQVCRELEADTKPAEISNDFGDGHDDPKGYARYQASRIGTVTVATVVDRLATRAAEHARHTANRTTIANAERDYSKGMRYARVPSGKKTCGFCLILASRGFKYKSEASAGYIRGAKYNSFHHGCDCQVVAGYEGTTLPGYDPDWYLDVYTDAINTTGSHDMDALAAEINRRSVQWVYRGKPGKLTGIESASKTVSRASKRLSERGIDVEATDTGVAMGKRSYAITDTLDTLPDAFANAAAAGLSGLVIDAGDGTAEDIVNRAWSLLLGTDLEEVVITGTDGIRRVLQSGSKLAWIRSRRIKDEDVPADEE